MNIQKQVLLVVCVILVLAVLFWVYLEQNNTLDENHSDVDDELRSRFVGSWNFSDSNTYAMTLDANGNFSLWGSYGSWYVQGGRLVFDYAHTGLKRICVYSFADDYQTLILIDSEGKNTTYTKA